MADRGQATVVALETGASRRPEEAVRGTDLTASPDRFINRVREIKGDVLAFSSGHIIRMIAARWLGLSPADGRFFYCRPASVGVLGYEHNSYDEPIIRAWNYVRLRQD